MAGHRRFQSAAERGAVDGADDRLGAVFEGREQGIEDRGKRLLARGELAELVDIGPAAKDLARSGEDDSLDRRVARKLLDRGDDALGHARPERVDRRIIDRDDANVAIFRQLDQITHGYSPCRPSRKRERRTKQNPSLTLPARTEHWKATDKQNPSLTLPARTTDETNRRLRFRLGRNYSFPSFIRLTSSSPGRPSETTAPLGWCGKSDMLPGELKRIFPVPT